MVEGAAPSPGIRRRQAMVLVGCVIGLAVSFAPIFHMSVFLKPLAATFGWSRTAVAAGTAAATLSLAAAAPFVGRLIDRIGPRRLILLAATAFAAAVALLGVVPVHYPSFIAVTMLIGVAGAGTTPLAYLALVSRWFDRHLGLAMGVAMIGIGIGMAAAPLVATHFIAAFGVRGALVAMAALALLAIPNALLLLREPVSGPAAPSTPAAPRPSLRPVLATPAFWYLCAAILLLTAGVAGSLVHLIAMLTDRGVSALAAAGTASAAGVALLCGRLLSGVLLDRVSTRALGSVTFLLGAGGMVALADPAAHVPAMVAAALIGFAQGAEGDLVAYAIRRRFPLSVYGVTYGLAFAAFNVGAFGGPLLMGWSYDALGSYRPGLLAAAAAVLAALSVWRIGPGERGATSDAA